MKAKYTAAKYDNFLPIILTQIKKTMEEKQDDFMLLNIGDPGTGKSMLSLHIMEYCMGNEADVKYIGLKRNDFAQALRYANAKEGFKMCNNDEANISNRDGFSQYSKDLIDLYLSIRGKVIFHIWNNPIVSMIDKYFVKDRIKGIIYITTKDKKLPRVYFYFRRQDIKRVLDKYGDLTLDTLRKAKKEYAFYQGWFRDYDGFLLKPYLEKKDSRMDEKIKAFCDDYGKEVNDMTITEVARELSVSTETIRSYTKELQARGKMGELMRKSGTGRWRYKAEAIPELKKIAEERKKKQEGTWINQ